MATILVISSKGKVEKHNGNVNVNGMLMAGYVVARRGDRAPLLPQRGITDAQRKRMAEAVRFIRSAQEEQKALAWYERDVYES